MKGGKRWSLKIPGLAMSLSCRSYAFPQAAETYFSADLSSKPVRPVALKYLQVNIRASAGLSGPDSGAGE
jgi:hypothetical protein